jgi:prepilin-type N-terminal cleavage/methylation domain-containing protein
LNKTTQQSHIRPRLGRDGEVALDLGRRRPDTPTMGRFAGRCARLRAARGRVHEASGFTIIEMLIAMTVLLIGMLGTFLLVGTANGNLSRTKAREGATNLARDLLESSRETAYAQIGQSGWFTSTLQNAPGGSGSVTFPATNSASTTVTRRKVSYTATVSWCSVDDNGDGYGTHGSSTAWCSGSGTTGTVDSQAEDFKRVSAAVSWTYKGVTQPTLTQTATFSSTGSVVGPTTSSLAITSPTGLDPTTPTVTSNPPGGIVTFLGSSTGAADMKFSINGVEQASGVTNNNNGTWSFNWNITTLADGTYTIGATGIDALGTRGQPRSLTVKLARGAATAPQNVTGGYNYVYVSGVKTLVVELDWDASPEGSVTGYEVRNGSTVECSASLATNCLDFTPASSGSSTYAIRTNYTDGAGNPQFVSTNYTVTRPGIATLLSLANSSSSYPSYSGIAGASCDHDLIGNYAGGSTATLTTASFMGCSPMPAGVSETAGSATVTLWFTNTNNKSCTESGSLLAGVTSYLGTASTAGATTLTVLSAAGFAPGQSVVIDSGATQETKTISSVSGNTITFTAGMTYSHALYVPVFVYTILASISGPTIPSNTTTPTSYTLTAAVPAHTFATGELLGLFWNLASNGNSACSQVTLYFNSTTNAVTASLPLSGGASLAQPSAPTGLTVTDNGDGTRTLRWTAPSSSNPAVDFYRIYRDGQNYTSRIDTVGDTQTCPSSTDICWTDTASGGTSHTYRVTSASHNLTESDFAGPVSG